MIPDLLHPLLSAASKSSSSSTSSSSSSMLWIFLLVIAVAGYFFWLRPQQQRQRKQREAQTDIHEGDEVVTVGGIVGRVIEMKDDRVHLLTGHHTTAGENEHLPHRMTFVRSAIARKVEPATPEPAANGSGEVDDFSFEHDEDDEAAGYDEGADGALEATAEADADEWAEDGTGDADPEQSAGGNGTAGRPMRRSGRGRRAGGGAKGGTSP